MIACGPNDHEILKMVLFICVQAEVVGQKITWLVPHPLSQVIPTDVDFRVMLTFLEFYEVNPSCPWRNTH